MAPSASGSTKRGVYVCVCPCSSSSSLGMCPLLLSKSWISFSEDHQMAWRVALSASGSTKRGVYVSVCVPAAPAAG